MDRKMQLLINADNLSPAYLEVILAEAEKYGVLCAKKIYGDWLGTNRRPWKDLLAKHSVEPVQAGVAESAMIMEALDTVQNASVDGIILVAYDSDFTQLAEKLKAADKTVIGMGDEITPVAYKGVCDEFVSLCVVATSGATEKKYDEVDTVVSRKEADGNVPVDGSHKDSEGVDRKKAAGEAKTPQEIAEEIAEEIAQRTVQEITEKEVELLENPVMSMAAIRKFIEEVLADEENNGKILMEKLALLLHQQFPEFNHKKWGYAKFPKFLEVIPGLEMVSVPSKYSSDFPKVYVVNSELGKDFLEKAAEGTSVVEATLSLEEIETAIIEIIDSEEYNGAIALGKLRYLLKGKYPEFDQKMYGRAKFSKFVEMLPAVRLVSQKGHEEGQNQDYLVVKK